MLMALNGRITTEYTVWCGHPDCAPEWDQNTASKAGCIRRWKQQGWRQTKKHGWVCPRHAEELGFTLPLIAPPDYVPPGMIAVMELTRRVRNGDLRGVDYVEGTIEIEQSS